MISCNKIGIKDYYKIIKRNVGQCYKNIKSDIKSFERISATVCVLDEKHSLFNTCPFTDKVVTPVREIAATKFNKELSEQINKEIEDELNVVR